MNIKNDEIEEHDANNKIEEMINSRKWKHNEKLWWQCWTWNNDENADNDEIAKQHDKYEDDENEENAENEEILKMLKMLKIDMPDNDTQVW